MLIRTLQGVRSGNHHIGADAAKDLDYDEQLMMTMLAGDNNNQPFVGLPNNNIGILHPQPSSKHAYSE